MKKIGVLIRKELLDILRDKKTLVMMVVVPIVLYPLLIIGMTLVIGSIMSSQENAVYIIGYETGYEETAKALEEIVSRNPQEFDTEIEFISFDKEEADSMLRFADVALRFKEQENGSLQVEISYDSANQNSSYACSMIENVVELYREDLVAEGLTKQGLDESFLYPVVSTTVDSASQAESFGMDIGGSIGMMMIVMILMGALYPAIDVTAGEKERGTLETLLTLPVTNFQMIFSKYVSVAVIACVTAVLSLVSMVGSVLFLIYGLAGDLIVEMGFSISGMMSTAPVLVVTMIVSALLCSALCMCFCVFAKSFKEANNYVTPLLLVVMIASMAGMIPSVTLDAKTALIPIVNVSLMMKQVLSQQFSLALAGLCNLVNLGASALIIWILAKMYDSENILFADGFRSFRLFQKRSDIKEGTVPDSGDLMISVTVLFLLMLYVGSAASVRLGFWGTLVSQGLILAIPLLLVWYMKSDVRTLFSLQFPKKGSIIGSVFLYLGVYCLIMVLSVALTAVFPESTENVELTFSEMSKQPFVILLLVTALMPAVGEEILFRGLLFGSIRENGKKRDQERRAAVYAILISSAVFGLFHMSLVKFFTTFLLGAVFAYIVWMTGSIYVTMCLHFVNNAFSMAVMKYPQTIGKVLPFLMAEELSVPEIAGILTVGVACAVLGLILLRRSNKTIVN